MTRIFPGLLLVSFLLSAPVASASTTLWRDTPRDLYIDGEIDRPAQILTAESPRRIAVFSTEMRQAVVFDLEAKRVSTMPRTTWTFAADRLTATTPEQIEPRRTNKLRTTNNGVYLANVAGRALALTSHHSIAGFLTQEELFRDFPVWKAIAAAYQPEASSVTALRSVSEPLTVRIAFATWCGDSRNYVPKVLATLRAAANPNISVELLNIGPDFDDPLDFIQENRIMNVPTIILDDGRRELGRIVETPATPTLEGDLAAIVQGTLPAHQGRIARAARLASGRYAIVRGASEAPSFEDWAIFSTPSGGHLVHSVITSTDRIREIWQTFDTTGRTTFIEVTDHSGNDSRRTRYRVGSDVIRAQSRGNTTGIVSQVVHVPDELTVDTTAIASSGFAYRRIRDVQREIDCYILGDCGTKGEVDRISIRLLPDEHIDVANMPRHALQFERIRDAKPESLWVDAELGITLKRTGSDGSSATLTSFTLH